MNFIIKKHVQNLPSKPGVYIYKNSKHQIIYIGKAKNIKKRVSSYFNKKHDDKTALLIHEINNLEFIVTDNEVEALILEAKLIRQHRPKYNIDLKDSVRYAYLKITDEEYPRLLTVRIKDKDNAKYFGPFTDGTAREHSARLLRSIFSIRTCGKMLPNQVCLQYYIGNCDAPCIDNVSKSNYSANVTAMSAVIKGQTKKIMKLLENEMKVFSQQQNYELAKKRRDQIKSLRTLATRQKISVHKLYNEDILHYIMVADTLYLQLFRVNKGQLTDRQEFSFSVTEEIIESFIRQYYGTNEIPDNLILPRKLADQDLLEAYLTKLKGKKVNITIPMQGRKKKLLDMVYKNVSYSIAQEDRALVNLQRHLNLSGIPNVIECFDISNIQGEFIVGSMVRFKGGVPDKSHYRRFKIKTVTQQDDFAAMAEIVKRRYSRLLKDKLDMPNLIVIDGGRGQLNASWEVLNHLNIRIPIIGLAKKQKEIYRIESLEVLNIAKKESGLKLLQQIRDEAHRFAITYHRLLRKKNLISK